MLAREDYLLLIYPVRAGKSELERIIPVHENFRLGRVGEDEEEKEKNE
jgi:hypothetical protein